ncbi:MAG: M15 family metallopeptidase, partial [Cyanobacteria bacterium J06573_11]
PNYFADSPGADSPGADSSGSDAQNAHHHRSLLAEVMVGVGFRQHPNEWWHFSAGDQLWAWQEGDGVIARYGRAS